MFDLEKESVHAIVSQMVYKEELMASLDEPTQCMVMHRTEPSRLQSLALQLSDKITQLVENNERLLELRPGWQSNWKGRDGDKHGGDNRQGGYQNRGDNREGRGGRGGGNFGRGNRGGGHFGGDRKGQGGYNRENKGNWGDRGGHRGGRYNQNDNRGNNHNYNRQQNDRSDGD